MNRARALAVVLMFGISLGVAGVAAEVALRVFARGASPLARTLGSWDPYAVKVEPHGVKAYRPRAGTEFDYFESTAHENAAGYRGPLVATPKPAGTVRIILLGESTTHGWGVVDSQTIDTYMRALLNTGAGQRYEVVNLAFDGYDAYQLWQRLETDGVPLQPDLIIANTGINDVRNARFAHLTDADPRTLLWADELRRVTWEKEHGGPALGTRLKHYFYLARLPGVLRQVRAASASGPRRAESVYPDAAVEFSRNVGRIADVAARLRVPLLLSTPPSVLTRPGGPAEMAPRSYWIVDKPTTQAYRDTLAARLVTIARERSARGERVVYVPHDMPPSDFLDDCHLTAQGNRRMAEDFVRAATPLLGGK